MTTNHNLLSRFLEVADLAGAKPLLIAGDTPLLGFGDLDRESGRLAARLLALGGQAGDRVVVQVEKSASAVLLYLAALRSGMIFVPLNPAYTAAELAYFLDDAQPAVIVCRPADEAAVRVLAGSATVVTLDPDGTGSLLQDLPQDMLPVVMRESNDIAAILYTSGTTGRSKGAMLSHGNLASNATTLNELWEWQQDDVLIHILPIYHVHGLFVALHGALLAGASVLFHQGFDPVAVIADFARATVLMGVPTHYMRLIDAPGLTRKACKPMRLFISGSAPLSVEAHEQFAKNAGQRILERYGMTETGMITSNPCDGERVAGTVGFPLPKVTVRLRDAQGQPVELGEPGILEVRGPNVFKGYWRNPEKTAEDFREGGYFVTGDIATRDSEGRITLVGRAKDLIIGGGLNIYPKEIEEAIDALPGVAESAVIGVPHPDLGEAVVAIVVRRPNTQLTEAGILAALVTELARFKQPRRIFIVDSLPRNAMGKVQKATLRIEHAGLFAVTPVAGT